ncbi:SRPBCC family protein [Nocardioides sp. KIGAM211]|uniref:SRPBCC family protein n=1 Tax=Nocardioides luti TaxID=2761101 RepID=A0A7X0RGI8_9ACTN|nr:SRPBCC family protein [Nocardioides luti]MBB6627894.1 SRPBCC family protein [Nocardioides luti]
MASFTASTSAEAVVKADRDAIWAVLVDPAKIARLTPFVRRITADGDAWFWEMTGVEVVGVGFAPKFTEAMTFTDHDRIDFEHAPPAGAKEKAGVRGFYVLKDVEGGTHLETSLEVTVELPLPKMSSPAVTSAMKGVMATMGDRFSRNLLKELGVPR